MTASSVFGEHPAEATPKKSIKVELVEGIYIFGHDELNLNAEYLDWTKLRECLSYMYYDHIGQIVPEVHLVEVVFNGETQGAYLSVEDVDSDFLLNTNLPDEAVIYKCTDRYTTLDRVDELEPYTKKTHESQPWNDFLLLLYWLQLCPEEIFREQLQERFHYSDLLSSVAANVLLRNGSTYYHNYLLLLDATGETGRWRYMAWDMDRTWWKYGPEFSYHKNSSNNGNRRNTLIWRMWCNQTIREELFAEMQRQYPLPFSIRISEQENGSGDITVSWLNAGNQCSWRLAISPDSLFSNPDDALYEAFPSDTFHTIPAAFTGSDL